MNIIFSILQAVLFLIIIVITIPIIFGIVLYVNLKRKIRGENTQSLTDFFTQFAGSAMPGNKKQKKTKESTKTQSKRTYNPPKEFVDADYREIE